MKFEILSLDDLQFEKVSFFTVKATGRPCSEFEDFIARMSLKDRDRKQLGEINRFIDNIGTFYGARDEYFKREGYAERLPPPYYHFIDSDGQTDFGLRLYCIKVSEEIVILLNGDRKTAQSVQDCVNCFRHFQLANQISNAFYEAKQNDDIEIDGHDILVEDNFLLNTL